jgi:hypothetical protein
MEGGKVVPALGVLFIEHVDVLGPLWVGAVRK